MPPLVTQAWRTGRTFRHTSRIPAWLVIGAVLAAVAVRWIEGSPVS